MEGSVWSWTELQRFCFCFVFNFYFLLNVSKAERRAQQMLFWDVNNGVARRAWAGNSNANLAIREAMEANKGLHVTLAHSVSESLQHKLAEAVQKK